MRVTVSLNPRHENDRRISFLEVLAASGNDIELTYYPSDLKDTAAEPSLENLGVEKYLTNLVNAVVYVDLKGKSHELYRKVNIIHERKTTTW
jgi:hypothetical protein